MTNNNNVNNNTNVRANTLTDYINLFKTNITLIIIITGIIGFTFFISFVFVGINLIIDLTYGLIDPRVKLGKRLI